MTLRFRNTLGNVVEDFQPLEPGTVRMYSCGPTVYAPAHVGNFRSFLFADLLRRYLEWKGFAVTWVMNITDVDDKIIRDARAEGVPIGDLTARHTAAFLADMDRLRVTRPDVLPKATDHIPEMVALIKKLIDGGHAYRTDEGSIFFRISSWPEYGRLATSTRCSSASASASRPTSTARTTCAISRSGRALARASPAGTRRSGPGRPGWHIECSAMSMKYLGESFDIHTGGVDLVFPHHEDEIAQSEAATGKPFVRTWMHCAHLQMGGEKMAKRVGNIARPAELYAEGITPRALRYALLAVHYRAPLEFSSASLAAAAAAVDRLSTALAALDAYREDRADDESLPALLRECPFGVRGRARRRPQHLGRARVRLRPGARAESTDGRAQSLHG